MTSGADALIVDLEDSISPAGKEGARKTALAFLKKARTAKQRPRLLVRVNAIETGLIDDDLDAVMAAAPDMIMLPKAEGGASVIHLDAKLAVREAENGLPENATGIVAAPSKLKPEGFLATQLTSTVRYLRQLPGLMTTTSSPAAKLSIPLPTETTTPEHSPPSAPGSPG